MEELKMRLMTNVEWDRMCDLVNEDDDKMHWDSMYSWVAGRVKKRRLSASHRSYRGYYSARLWIINAASGRYAGIGFRPVVEGLAPDTLPSGSNTGDAVVIGTLYMDDKPVRVPQNPTYDGGDIEDYIPGATLEMREPLDNPAYRVTGILDGDKVYVDRCLLKNISYDDIEQALGTQSKNRR